jgi:hypothetical protein
MRLPPVALAVNGCSGRWQAYYALARAACAAERVACEASCDLKGVTLRRDTAVHDRFDGRRRVLKQPRL